MLSSAKWMWVLNYPSLSSPWEKSWLSYLLLQGQKKIESLHLQALYFSLVVLSDEILSNSAKNKALEVRDFVKSAALSIWRGARRGWITECWRGVEETHFAKRSLDQPCRNFQELLAPHSDANRSRVSSPQEIFPSLQTPPPPLH